MQTAECCEVPPGNNAPRSCVPVGSPTVLMMTHPLRYLPLARHHATICSAGSRGYCAVKEMLQSGVPGHSLLMESGDLRNLESSAEECCLIYSPSEDDDEHNYSEQVPTSTTHLTLYSNCVCLPASLLQGCSGLTSLDLSPLSRVTEVRACFLYGCSGLTSLNLSPLSQVKVVQRSFLGECSGLTTLDLSPLSKIRVVQRSFLRGCSGLTALDLSPLLQVTAVHDSFLHGCIGLKALNLSPLSQVTVIQGSFLQGCSGLTTLDLSALSKVTVIRGFFLQGCSGLKTLNLSALSQVTEVYGTFLQGCSGLKTLDLSPLSQVTVVGRLFLGECDLLDDVKNPPTMCPPPSGLTVCACSTTGTRKWVRKSVGRAQDNAPVCSSPSGTGCSQMQGAWGSSSGWVPVGVTVIYVRS